MKKTKIEKVCFVLNEETGERTRFFKNTSKQILKRKAKSLKERGKSFIEMTKNVYERKFGELNKPKSPLVVIKDLKFSPVPLKDRLWAKTKSPMRDHHR